MIIYCNNSLKKKDVYDIESIYYDNFIYSNRGIYKKYKNHFYELDICERIESVNIDNITIDINLPFLRSLSSTIKSISSDIPRKFNNVVAFAGAP